MKVNAILVSLVAASVSCLVSNAGVLSASLTPVGSQSFQGYSSSFQGSTLSIAGAQYSSARMIGSIQTSDPSDPDLTITGSVTNATANPWQGYQVNVTMDQPFSFTTPGPTASNTPTDDWFVYRVDAPALQSGGQYLGTLWFSAGTPVPNGGSLDLLYTLSFASSTDYSFTQDLIPWTTPVPEPSALALLGLGGLGLMWRLARKSR